MKVSNKKLVPIIAVIVFLAIAVGLYVIIYVYPTIAGYAKQTYVMEHKELPLMDEEEVLFVRNETLYLAWGNGQASRIAAEGEKVRLGTQIYAIDSAVPEGEEGEAQEEENDEDNDKVIADFDSIIPTAGANAVVSENGFAPVTAIASYYADGYEGQINMDTLPTLSKDIFETLPDEAAPLSRDWVRTGDPIYKLTDNNFWHVALWVDLKSDALANYEVGNTVTLDMETTKITAKIEEVVQGDKDCFVLISSDMYYKDLVKYRKKNIKIIFAEYSGAIIENSSIISVDDRPGVYVKQRSGTFKWIPIKVRMVSGEQSIVFEDKFYDDEGIQIDTVDYYDEILKDPKSEGY